MDARSQQEGLPGAVQANLVIEDEYVENLPPLDLSPEEREELFGDGGPDTNVQTDDDSIEPGVQVDVAQVMSFLRLFYKAAGFISREREIWAVDDDELYEIAIRLAPKINAHNGWAKAVQTMDEESVWFLVTYSVGKRILATIRAKRSKAAATREGGPVGGAPGTTDVTVFDYSQFDNSGDPAL